MRGRILWATLILGVMALAACTKKDSLYIDTSKDGAPPPEASETKPPPAGQNGEKSPEAPPPKS